MYPLSAVQLVCTNLCLLLKFVLIDPNKVEFTNKRLKVLDPGTNSSSHLLKLGYICLAAQLYTWHIET